MAKCKALTGLAVKGLTTTCRSSATHIHCMHSASHQADWPSTQIQQLISDVDLGSWSQGASRTLFCGLGLETCGLGLGLGLGQKGLGLHHCNWCKPVTSSSPTLSLCQISFLSRRPLLNYPMVTNHILNHSLNQSFTLLIWCPRESKRLSFGITTNIWCNRHHNTTSSSAMADRPCDCAYIRQVHCAVVDTCYTSALPSREHDLFMLQSRHFMKEVGHFRRIFHREGGVAHQPLLVSEN